MVTFCIPQGRVLNSTWTSEQELLGPLSQLLAVEVLHQNIQLSPVRSVDKIHCNDAEIGCKWLYLAMTNCLSEGCDYTQTHLGIWWRV